MLRWLVLSAYLFGFASWAYGQETTTFRYDHSGRRIEKTSAGVRTSTLMGGAYVVARSSATKYIRGPGGLVASITNSQTRYLHPDHLGSVSVVTDANGTEVARYVYTPYGESIRAHSTGQDVSRHKFTGQEEDEETRLQYYVARYRDPETTLWLSADTQVPSEDTLGYNRHAYVRGNPLKYSDPTGHEPEIGPAPLTADDLRLMRELLKGSEIDAVNIRQPFDETMVAAIEAVPHALLFNSAKSMVDRVLARSESQSISRLTIWSHGVDTQPTSIDFGRDVLMLPNFERYASEFGRLRGHFADGGFIHLAACSAGNNLELLRRIAQVVGVTVYASTGDNTAADLNRGKLLYRGMIVGCDPDGLCSGPRQIPAMADGLRAERWPELPIKDVPTPSVTTKIEPE